MKKALIAMSGGVDSSVAALLTVKNGYEVIGATAKMLEGFDTSDAEAVAEKLGVKFYAFDMQKEFRTCVMQPFSESYFKGKTPNPCVECNKKIKFGALFDKAAELGCDILVTGHYARTEYSEKYGRILLKKAVCEKKDQSYFLYSLSREKLERVSFPLGALSKSEVRAIAESEGFCNSHKKDSQDICFVPNGEHSAVAEEIAGEKSIPGLFTDKQGNPLGRHEGIVRYTVGQRKGLGVAFGKPMYVFSKNAEDNTVVLSENEELFGKELKANELVFSAFDEVPRELRCKAKIRYRHKEAAATVTVENGVASVVFDEPQRAIAPGQAVVFYDGEYVIGGGIIM